MRSGAHFDEFGLDFILQKVWQILEHVPEIASSAIIAVWLILALTRAGRKPSNWLEIPSLIFGAICVVWWVVHFWVFYADLAWFQGDAFTW